LTWSNYSIILFELTILINTQHYLLAARAKKQCSLLYDLQQTVLIVGLISGCLSHFMPETLAQVATACCVPKKAVWSLYSRQLVLPPPALLNS